MQRLILLVAFSFLIIAVLYFIGKRDFNRFNYSKLESGDIIFTRGNSIKSYVVMLFDRNTDNYSHCGTIYKKKNKYYIIHATPTPIDGKVGRVLMEPLDDFFRSNAVTLVSVFRLKSGLKKHLKSILSTTDEYEKKLTLFDVNFSLTDDKLYCTELIWKSFLKSGLDLTAGKNDLNILFPSDLMKSDLLQPVYFF